MTGRIVRDKLVEELLELATIITQQKNKPHKDLTRKIENEIADVKVWLTEFEVPYDWDYIDDRIKAKRKKHKLNTNQEG